MHPKITVVTSCTGTRDTLCEKQNTTDARFVAYVDNPVISENWEQRLACEKFISGRRNSRIHKLLIHQYVNTEYSLWIDANMQLLVPAEELIGKWLKHHDIAMFKHRIRTCTYQEAEICARLKLDDPELITEQADRYRADGFPENAGLGEACVILRRHTKEIEAFNNAWWAEYSRYSVRDQISLMVAARKTGTKINLVTPTKFNNPYFCADHRPPGIEPWTKEYISDLSSDRETLLEQC